MRSASEIAARALVRAGVLASGETPTAAEISDAVSSLGDMLDSWSLERLMVSGSAEVVIAATGSDRYTIGPSGDVVAARPLALVSAFARSGGEDVPLTQASPAYMDDVCRKDAKGSGHFLSLEGTMPDATVRLWPAPASGTVHLRVTQPVTQIAHPADALDLPAGWYQALVLNLAVHLCGEYGFAAGEDLAALAIKSKASIKRANIQPAHATFDRELL